MKLIINLEICKGNKVVSSINNIDLLNASGINLLRKFNTLLHLKLSYLIMKSSNKLSVNLVVVDSDLPEEITNFIEREFKTIDDEEDIPQFMEYLCDIFKFIINHDNPNIVLGAFYAMIIDPINFELCEIADTILSESYYYRKEDKDLEKLGIELASEYDFYYELENESVLKFFDFAKFAKEELKKYTYAPMFGYYYYFDI